MKQNLSNIQTQQQQQLLQQHLTPQQVLVVRMLEMPLAQFEDRVRQELDVNPSLEAKENDDADDAMGIDTPEADTADALDTPDADDAIDNKAADADDDDYVAGQFTGETREHQDAVDKTFVDTLIDQMRMEELTPTQEQIMEYLIGSLDNDGLLRKDLDVISDELAIYNNLFVTREEIEEVLDKLQDFDPAGVGGRSLQECLLIQIERMQATPMTMLLYRIINECYDDFTHNRWAAICKRLDISEDYADQLRLAIRRRLNPKPGGALGESVSRSMQQITPDFIVSIDYDGQISFELNKGRTPQLYLVREDEDFLRQCEKSPANAQALEFTRRNVDRAKMFIDAIRQRNETMVRTMKVIINLQRQYFLTGDESDLRPMLLKDVAEPTGYDLSTISRVTRAKYVQTPWGTYQLRHFFSDGYSTGEGDEVSTKAIKSALREAISAEDPRRPLSDDKLVSIMAAKGYPIARRTIAKYREQLGIPIARLRKR